MAFEMAKEQGFGYTPNLDDGELWLPSDVLSEDISPPKMKKNCGYEHQFPYEFPYEWGSSAFQVDSSLSSPVESAVGLSETDEEDDYMAGLAERVAYAMLDDDGDDDDNCEQKVRVHHMKWASEQRIPVDHETKKCVMARSPQSTLTGVGSWSTGSSKGSSQVSSPPSTPLTTDAWDLLHMAADQVVRLNMMIPDTSTHGHMQGNPYKAPLQGFMVGHAARKIPSPSQVQWNQTLLPSHVLTQQDLHNTVSSLYGLKSTSNGSQSSQRNWNPRPRVEDRKNPAHQYQQPKQCPVSGLGRQTRPTQVQQVQSRTGHNNNNNKSANRSHPPCPPGQQMGGGSGMRAVFLGSNGPGRESGGTGVFLPRRMDNGAASKRKPACSTVLLPARIVQALNLNVEDLRSQPCGLSDTSCSRRDYGRSADYQKQVPGESWSEAFYPVCTQIQAPSSEISLPQEWTY